MIQIKRVYQELEMKISFRNRRTLAALLSVFLLIGVFQTSDANAQRSRGYYRGPHHSRTKGALIGGLAGLVGGALIGGKKGAVIGAGAGSGTGYLIQRHRHDRRYRRYYRRY
jgi:osmotically inducible lipoprotein OsmB